MQLTHLCKVGLGHAINKKTVLVLSYAQRPSRWDHHNGDYLNYFCIKLVKLYNLSKFKKKQQKIIKGVKLN